MSSIIKHAQADVTDSIKGHIPEAPHSANFPIPGENEGNLRFVAFSSIHAQKLSVRVLRAAVFRRLEPITNLRSGEEFMRVWFQCVQNHYARWERGLGHTDPSVANLMTNPLNKNKGIFNDWDLAVVRVPDKENLPHSGRAGILPFMALDLLTEAYHDGETPRLYRHDLEAFIWILPWVFLQYQNGERAFNIFRSWESADYREVHSAKNSFLSRFVSEAYIVGEDSPFYDEWLITKALLSWLRAEESHRIEEQIKPQHMSAPTALKRRSYPDFIHANKSTSLVAEPEKEPRQVYREFWNAIVEVIRWHPQELDYVHTCIPNSI